VQALKNRKRKDMSGNDRNDKGENKRLFAGAITESAIATGGVGDWMLHQTFSGFPPMFFCFAHILSAINQILFLGYFSPNVVVQVTFVLPYHFQYQRTVMHHVMVKPMHVL